DLVMDFLFGREKIASEKERSRSANSGCAKHLRPLWWAGARKGTLHARISHSSPDWFPARRDSANEKNVPASTTAAADGTWLRNSSEMFNSFAPARVSITTSAKYWPYRSCPVQSSPAALRSFSKLPLWSSLR